jgi:hypothetical protein
MAQELTPLLPSCVRLGIEIANGGNSIRKVTQNYCKVNSRTTLESWMVRMFGPVNKLFIQIKIVDIGMIDHRLVVNPIISIARDTCGFRKIDF